MSVRNTVKSIQDIMRQDTGVDGDAQRISQLCWLFFLKIIDDQDKEMSLLDKKYRSPVGEHVGVEQHRIHRMLLALPVDVRQRLVDVVVVGPTAGKNRRIPNRIDPLKPCQLVEAPATNETPRVGRKGVLGRNGPNVEGLQWVGHGDAPGAHLRTADLHSQQRGRRSALFDDGHCPWTGLRESIGDGPEQLYHRQRSQARTRSGPSPLHCRLKTAD